MTLLGFGRNCLIVPLVVLSGGTLLPQSSAAPPPAVAEGPYVPVAQRPRGELLAKGADYLRPDLTRGMVNDYRDLLAWILNIRFSDAQCDEFEQRMITRWPSLYKIDTDVIAGASKQMAEMRGMPPAQLRVTYKTLHEQVLKNLHDMVGGAMMLGSFKVVSEDDRRDAQWLLSIYEEQHPEAIAPPPAMPDVPGIADPPRAEPHTNAAPRPGAAATTEAAAAGAAVPLPQSAGDAMSRIVCFLSAKSRNAEYLPPSDDFRALLARKLAEEYSTYSPEQQAALAALPSYWTQLSGSWDRMSQRDRDATLARWKPLLDSLQAANAPVQDLSAADQAALANMTGQAARTREHLEQIRARQMDLNQKMQLQQMERMQHMQEQQIVMMSNIARSAHETNMRIIDNMGPVRHPWDR